MEINTNILATSSEIRDVHESILEDILDKAKSLLQKGFSVISIPEFPPWGRRGFKPRIRPPCPQRVVKGD